MQDYPKFPSYLENWYEKFAPLLVNGLTDGPTYVRLATKSLPTLDVVLAIRPVMQRLDSNALMIGGKVSVFPIKESLKANPSSEDVMVSWLTSAYPQITFQKVSAERVGTTVLSVQNAPYKSGKSYVEAFKEADTVGKLLTYIEGLIGEPIDNRQQVARAISEALLAQVPFVFSKFVIEEAPKGSITEAQGFTNSDNVIQLASKKMLSSMLGGDMEAAVKEDMAAAPVFEGGDPDDE